MPHISAIKKSSFLTKDDCGRGILVTIKACVEENVAAQGAPPEHKWCLHFHEQEKPMVLNSTNAQIIAAIIGNENTDGWVGHKVVLFHDPNVSYAGKLIGGIRARAPRVQPAQINPQANRPAPAPAPAPPAYIPSVDQPMVNQDADDVPFSIIWALALLIPFSSFLA